MAGGLHELQTSVAGVWGVERRRDTGDEQHRAGSARPGNQSGDVVGQVGLRFFFFIIKLALFIEGHLVQHNREPTSSLQN